jgi:hypothetical protein
VKAFKGLKEVVTLQKYLRRVKPKTLGGSYQQRPQLATNPFQLHAHPLIFQLYLKILAGNSIEWKLFPPFRPLLCPVLAL